jgi:hypothetical protein
MYLITQDRGHLQGVVLGDPAQIRPLAREQTGSRFNQQRKRRTPPDATGVQPGQDLFSPAIPRLTACPLAAFAPQDAEAVRALRTLCQPLGRANQMRQATLPCSLPVLRDERPIADEDTRPVREALRQRCPPSPPRILSAAGRSH